MLCAPDGSRGTTSVDQFDPSRSHERARHFAAGIPTPTTHAFVVDEASTANGVDALENTGVVTSVQTHDTPAPPRAPRRENLTRRSPTKVRRTPDMAAR
jgi:hypothetical protein